MPLSVATTLTIGLASHPHLCKAEAASAYNDPWTSEEAVGQS